MGEDIFTPTLRNRHFLKGKALRKQMGAGEKEISSPQVTVLEEFGERQLKSVGGH